MAFQTPNRAQVPEVYIHEDADQREDRQSRDLWAEAAHP